MSYTDSYWEAVREYRERELRPGDPEYQEECLEEWLLIDDDELDEIERKAGYSIEDFTEHELMEIVENHVAIETRKAAWDPSTSGILYEYVVA